MAPRFSIVYPTRHRPAFVQQALRILERQQYEDFEVVVCDNFTDPAQSCEQLCRDAGLAHLRYVRPPQPVGMVDNWNHALSLATGDYVTFLTDKMFMLPDALGLIDRALDAAGGPEIVSWTSDGFAPADFADYFGSGLYVAATSTVRSRLYRRYSPAQALDVRGRAERSRPEQSPAEWARGKIVFGAYSRELIARVHARSGPLFRDINPDYTSMILGLSEARDAIELGFSCVVSITTDLSNGMQSDANDAAALQYLRTLSTGLEAIFDELLVPGLYVSIHNWVAHDYLTLKRILDLPFRFSQTNWLAYCYEDVHRPGRRWSDVRVEAEQKGRLDSYIQGLEASLREALKTKIAERAARVPGKAVPPGALAALRDRLPMQFRRHRRASSVQSAVEQLASERSWVPWLRAW